MCAYPSENTNTTRNVKKKQQQQVYRWWWLELAKRLWCAIHSNRIWVLHKYTDILHIHVLGSRTERDAICGAFGYVLKCTIYWYMDSGICVFSIFILLLVHSMMRVYVWVCSCIHSASWTKHQCYRFAILNTRPENNRATQIKRPSAIQRGDVYVTCCCIYKGNIYISCVPHLSIDSKKINRNIAELG